MDSKIFKNSFIVALITFILLCVLFYLSGTFYETRVENNKVVKKFSWKAPLAISLIVWVLWHFYLYPPPEEMDEIVSKSEYVDDNMMYQGENVVIPERMLPKNSSNRSIGSNGSNGSNGLGNQKISLAMWY